MPSDLGMQQGQFGVIQPQGLEGLLGGPSAATGYYAGQLMQNAQQNQGMQQLLNNLIMQANQSKLTEYGANAPVRELERQAAIETTLPTARTKLAGEQERVMQAQAQTPGIQAETRGKITKEQVEKAEREAEKFTIALPSFQGPTATQDFESWADENNLSRNHPIRKGMAGATSSEDFQRRGQHYASQVARHAAQRRREYDMMIETGSRERIADIQATAAERAAEARENTARDKADREKKLEERAVAIYHEIQDARRKGDKTREQQLGVEFNELTRVIQLIKAAGAPAFGPQISPQGGIVYPQRTPQPGIPGATPPATDFVRDPATGKIVPKGQ